MGRGTGRGAGKEPGRERGRAGRRIGKEGRRKNEEGPERERGWEPGWERELKPGWERGWEWGLGPGMGTGMGTARNQGWERGWERGGTGDGSGMDRGWAGGKEGPEACRGLSLSPQWQPGPVTAGATPVPPSIAASNVPSSGDTWGRTQHGDSTPGEPGGHRGTWGHGTEGQGGIETRGQVAKGPWGHREGQTPPPHCPHGQESPRPHCVPKCPQTLMVPMASNLPHPDLCPHGVPECPQEPQFPVTPPSPLCPRSSPP